MTLRNATVICQTLWNFWEHLQLFSFQKVRAHLQGSRFLLTISGAGLSHTILPLPGRSVPWEVTWSAMLPCRFLWMRQLKGLFFPEGFTFKTQVSKPHGNVDLSFPLSCAYLLYKNKTQKPPYECIVLCIWTCHHSLLDRTFLNAWLLLYVTNSIPPPPPPGLELM